jgi:DNA invertase Pin-like site-specific DNA recombinase
VSWSKAKRDGGAGAMTIVGYARVSTTDQDLSIQETALRAAGCDVIRAEKRSGTTTVGREQLRTVLDFLHKGDVLMVTRIDRLGSFSSRAIRSSRRSRLPLQQMR